MTKTADNCLVLEIEQEKEFLRMCIFLKEEAATVRHYARVEVSLPEINRLHRSIILFLNKADRFGTLDAQTVQDLRKICQLLYDQLLDKAVKDRLKEAREKNLVLSLDESIAYLPWEILFDGKDFLCLKFNLGRSMRIKDVGFEPDYKAPSQPLNMLILADPQGDLESCAKEAGDIKNSLDNMREVINLDFKISNISSEYVKKNMRDYDILHYAGHAEYFLDRPQDSGWVLEDGKLKAKDILKIGETGSMPTLVFAHACETVGTGIIELESEKEIYGLARSFLISGVRHYIACICKIPDQASRLFAREFYLNLIQDKPIGEALKDARLSLIKEYGQNQISWMAYIIFGDPMFRLSRHIGSLPLKRHNYRSLIIKFAITVFLLSAGTGLFFKFTSGRFSQVDFLYEQGRNQQLIAFCNNILSKDKDNLNALSRMGEIFQRLGKWDNSLEYYFRYAQASERKKDLQHLASGLVKIAWVYYLKGNYPQAFTFYNRAIELAQKTADKLTEAIALRKLAVWYMDKEDYEKAFQLLLKSSEINRKYQNIYAYRYNLACDYFDLGLIFTDKEDLKTAKEFYGKSLHLFKDTRVPSELSDYYSNMGEICQLNKEYSKAEDFYRLSLNMDKKLGNLPSEAATYNMIGELYLEMKDYTRAEGNFKSSLQIQQNIEDPMGKASVYYNFGQLYNEKGQKQLALEYLAKAQGIYKNIDTPDYQAVTQEIKELINK